MAAAHPELVNALRKAADNLRANEFYAWGHHGACNCGQLLQACTNFNKDEILSYAHLGIGEWTEISAGVCPDTAIPLQLLLSRLEQIGLTATDIHHIEYLSDRKVLEKLPGGFRWLKKNRREDVILYFETFADCLEKRMPKNPRKEVANRVSAETALMG